MKTEVSVVKTFKTLEEAIAHAKEYYSNPEHYDIDLIVSNLEKKSITNVRNSGIILIVDELGLLD